MKSLKNNQRGFTLIELSMVLIIIGLIIIGVLGGKQVIQNAQVTNTINAIQAYQSQFQSYVQTYGAIPGEDANDALVHFPSAGLPSFPSTTSATLVSAFDSTTTANDTRRLWSDLRAAGLVKSQQPVDAQPANPFGGIFGFQNTAFTGTTDGGLTTTVLCLNHVPAAAAIAIDSRLDDGTSSAGSVRAMAEPVTGLATGAAATSYGNALYTLCISM